MARALTSDSGATVLAVAVAAGEEVGSDVDVPMAVTMARAVSVDDRAEFQEVPCSVWVACARLLAAALTLCSPFSPTGARHRCVPDSDVWAAHFLRARLPARNMPRARAICVLPQQPLQLHVQGVWLWLWLWLCACVVVLTPCTRVQYDGNLYLLVTDLGYADQPQVVWEKLDMVSPLLCDVVAFRSWLTRVSRSGSRSAAAWQIDGDTAFVNELFKLPRTSNHAKYVAARLMAMPTRTFFFLTGRRPTVVSPTAPTMRWRYSCPNKAQGQPPHRSPEHGQCQRRRPTMVPPTAPTTRWRYSCLDKAQAQPAARSPEHGQWRRRQCHHEQQVALVRAQTATLTSSTPWNYPVLRLLLVLLHLVLHQVCPQQLQHHHRTAKWRTVG